VSSHQVLARGSKSVPKVGLAAMQRGHLVKGVKGKANLKFLKKQPFFFCYKILLSLNYVEQLKYLPRLPDKSNSSRITFGWQ
jgi:hypothetical protein